MLTNRLFNSFLHTPHAPKTLLKVRSLNIASSANSIFSRNFKLLRTFGTNKNSNADHFKILGLSKYRNSLTNEVLSKRFKELSLKYHPDLNPGKDTNEQYMEIKDSYESLKDFLTNREKNKAEFKDTNFEDSTETSKESNFRYYQRQASNFQNTRNASSNWDFKTEEEYIFYLIFGYNWDEDVDRFMLTQNAAKRQMFIEKVIELRKSHFQQEQESKGVTLEQPADNFGSGLDHRTFINQAFSTRFSGLGAGSSAKIEDEQSNPILKYSIIALILSGIAFMGYITSSSHSKKVTFFTIFTIFLHTSRLNIKRTRNLTV